METFNYFCLDISCAIQLSPTGAFTPIAVHIPLYIGQSVEHVDIGVLEILLNNVSVSSPDDICLPL